MAITTYALLQAAVADWVERSDLTTRLPTFIANAEAKVNRVLREGRMQAQDTASISAQLTELPTDFREAITAQVRASGSDPYSKLDPAPSDVIASYNDDLTVTGRPQFFGILGDQLMLYPTPDVAYTVLLTYFTKLPALSHANTTNWLLDDAPDVYLDGALAAFYEWDRDFEASNRYLQKFDAGLAEVMAQRRQPPPKLRVDRALAGRAHYNINTDA